MTYPEPDPTRPLSPADERVVHERRVVERGLAEPGAREQVVSERVEDSAAKRARTISLVCGIITFLCGLFATILAIHIVLTLADANPRNGFAGFIADFAGGVSLGFDGLFTPSSAKLAVLFDYGAAAIVWLLIGAAITYLIRRLALPGARREIRYRRTVE